MTEPRPRGRPKKVVAVPKEEINPDCQPATRGYVKCIARKIFKESKHVHKSPQPLVGFVMLFSFINVFITAASWASSPTHEGSIWVIIAAIFWVSLEALIAVVGSCLVSPEIDESLTGTLSWDNPNLDPAFEKHTPPPPICEKKEECG